MADLLPTSALAFFHEGTDGVALFRQGSLQLEERPLLGMVRLLGRQLDDGFYAQVHQSTDLALPDPGRIHVVGNLRCQWLAPGEWLFVTPPGGERQLSERLQPCLADRLARVSIISDSRVTVGVRGPAAVSLLSQGCALDLHPSHFLVHQGAVTRFAQLRAMLSRLGEASYEVTVDRAQAVYLWQWLIDAADGLQPDREN